MTVARMGAHIRKFGLQARTDAAVRNWRDIGHVPIGKVRVHRACFPTLPVVVDDRQFLDTDGATGAHHRNR